MTNLSQVKADFFIVNQPQIAEPRGRQPNEKSAGAKESGVPYSKTYYQKNKERILVQIKEYQLKNRQIILQKRKIYRLTHKEQLIQAHRKYNFTQKKNKPWCVFFSYIRSRCSSKNRPYYKKGIKNYLTSRLIKILWFRDKAHLMKCPSIDRKDSEQNYTFENCRFVELIENLKEGGRNSCKKLKRLPNGQLTNCEMKNG
jgi:hypothetical protein